MLSDQDFDLQSTVYRCSMRALCIDHIYHTCIQVQSTNTGHFRSFVYDFIIKTKYKIISLLIFLNVDMYIL